MTVKKEITKEQSTAAAQDVKENLSDNEGKVGGMLHDARVKKGYKIADIANGINRFIKYFVIDINLKININS